MHRGYTKRWRKRWDKKYHYDKDMWLMMDYFIDFANHKDSEVFFPNVGLIPLKRGQHIFGSRQIAEFLRIDRNRIRRKLKILENIGFLTLKKTHQYSIATVINYDTYNPLMPDGDPLNDPQTTRRRPADDPQTTTPNNVKNDKNVNKENKTPLYPPWLDMDLWKKFKEHRRRMRSPMTEEAERRNIIKLEKLINKNGGSPTQDEIIGQSIERGWKGLFELKDDFNISRNTQKQLRSAMASQQWLEEQEKKNGK